MMKKPLGLSVVAGVMYTTLPVTVTRYKRVFKYVSAGEPFVYATHQEIMLLRKDKA